MPSAAHVPVPRSIRDAPTRTPGRSGSPVTLMIPVNACISGSYPGCAASGPFGPNAPIEQ